MLLLRNCRMYNARMSENVSVLIKNGKIGKIYQPGEEEHSENLKVIECNGKILAPGFIDIHIQGAGGADFLDNEQSSIEQICGTLPRFGVTGILATTITRDDIANHHLRLISSFNSQKGKATRILGIHIEGPFINKLRRGGINEKSIKEPDMAYLEKLLEVTDGKLKMMTVAPELPGMEKIIHRLISADIVPALGHTNATYTETIHAFNIGVNHATHIFNAMRPIHHREPGPIIGIINTDDVTVQLISDGLHVSPVMIDFLRKSIGSNRITLISDGISALGYNRQNLIYNGKKYLLKNGTALYPNGTLIGTALPVNELAKRYMKYTGCEFAEAIESISLIPARVIGLEHKKGRIKENYDADVTVIDEKLNVYYTIVEGKIVYSCYETPE